MPDYTVHHGDCLDVLKTLPPNSVDSIVTDPPAGIAFMNSEWDEDKGGRDEWIAWLTSILVEAKRVLKPGGHALVWSLPRTCHWTGMACENAGYDVRDIIHHLFGSGFPKNHNISAYLDKSGGVSPDKQAQVLRAKREHASMSREQLADAVGCTVSSIRDWEEGRARTAGGAVEFMVPSAEYREKLADILGYTKDERRMLGSTVDRRGDGSTYGLGHSGVQYGDAATDLAKQWEGWGTALKPSVENWWLLRKPLEGTVAANVTKYGVGGINIDGCRIETQDNLNGGAYAQNGTERHDGDENWRYKRTGRSALPGDEREGASAGMFQPGKHVAAEFKQPIGRWPGNVILGPEAAAELDAVNGTRTSGMIKPGQQRKATVGKGGYGDGFPNEVTATGTYGDSGGISRYFYCPKASRSEREAGLDYFPSRNVNDGRETSIDNPYQRGDTERKNTHPTSKNLELMQYLVRLITPKGGTVLDPFTGSGSTGCAAMLEGMNFVGIEREAEYVDIARARIAYWGNHKAPELIRQDVKVPEIVPIDDEDIL